MEKTKVGKIELTAKEIEAAQKEGALEYVKEGGARAMAADTGTTSDLDKAAEQQQLRVAPDLHSTQIAPLLELSTDELKRRLGGKDDDAIDFEVTKGLLHLERSGKNRTGYVNLLIDAISKQVGRKVKVTEVTNAGPPYTNDETAVTEL